MELGNLAEEREAEEKEDSDSNRHSGDEDDESKGGNKRNVARTFRYMRKRPTIIFYKPPEGELKPQCDPQQKSSFQIGDRLRECLPFFNYGIERLRKLFPLCSGH